MTPEDYIKAIDHLNSIMHQPGTWQWTQWKRKYAWFPILHDDWSITWLKWYKVRYGIYYPINLYDQPRIVQCQYLIERVIQ